MLEKLFKNFDFWILSLTLAISSFGLVIIWSIRPDLVGQQAIFFALGFFLFFLFSRIDYHLFAYFRTLLYLLICVALILTFLFAPQTRGAARWLEIGSLRLQASEIMKPFLILAFSGFLRLYPSIGFKRLFSIGILAFVPLLLIFKQPDLGNTIIFLLILISLLFVGGLKWRLIFGGLLLFLGTIPILERILKDYQRERITSFLNPQGDPLGTGYHLIQAMVTVGSGQIFGRGLGRGTQTHLWFLPEQHTDFIFASLSEELGLLGATLLIVLYGLILWRILTVARNCKDQYGILISAGVFTMVLAQVFINIGMNIGILPITGVTLPLLSYGGSSIISTMVSLGIVESIARDKRRMETLEIK